MTSLPAPLSSAATAVVDCLARLPWPAPAVLAWSLAWLGWLAARLAGCGNGVAFGIATALGLALAATCHGRWRRGIAAAGFPLSALALGAAAAVPPWVWLLPLLLALAAYPVRAWRDAPFFPTPRGALQALPGALGSEPASVLDAGCGLGHGLAELHARWPRARLHGVEWSAPLAWAAALRCRRFASVARGDLWAGDWSAHDLVYVFQRPESMQRVLAKARREMAPGSWLVSLEFAVTGYPADARLACPDGRDLWLYRMPSGAPTPRLPGSTRGHPGR